MCIGNEFSTIGREKCCCYELKNVVSFGGYASDSVPEMEIILNGQKTAFTKRHIEVIFTRQFLKIL